MSEPTETPYLRAAFLSAPLSALLSVGTALLALFVASGTGDSMSAAGRSAAHAWLASMGAGLSVDNVDITIIPIGAWLLVVGLIALVSRWVLADPVDELPAFVASTGGVLGLVAGVAAAATSTGDVEIGIVRAAAAGFVTGSAGAALGAVTKHGGGSKLWFTISDDLRRAVRGAVPAIVTMLSVATVLVLGLLLWHREQAGQLWALIDPGLGGGLVLALTCVLALPNAILWACSALIGPGFVIGTDTSVDLTGSYLGAVPGFPIFAALPSPGEFPGWVFVLGLVPLISGAVSGWRADTGGRDGLAAQILAGAAAGAVAGFLLGGLIGVSGGSIGPGRMAEAGPPALTPLLVGVLVMGLGGAIGAALSHYRDLRATARSQTASSAERASSPGGSGVGERNDSAGTDRRDDES